MRTLRIRKLVIVPVADVVEDGEVIGEWQGHEISVFRGSRLFPQDLAVAMEAAVPQDRLAALETM